MARILLTWELGEGLGHVASLRPVALELQGRGHDVVIAVRNVRSAESIFRGTGLSFVQCPYQTWNSPSPFGQLRSYAHMLHSVSFNDPEGLAALVRAWESLFALVEPDLIVFDHSPTALLAARPLKVEKVILGLGFFSPPAVTPLPALMPGPDTDVAGLERDEAVVLELVNTVQSRFSRSPLGNLSDLYTEVDLDLLTTYEELDAFGPRHEETRYWGIHNEVSGQQPVWPAGTGKRVFAYLKPMPGIEGLLARLREIAHPTIVFGTWVNEEARNRFGSETLSLVRQPVDVTAVGEQCDLAILNGTHGTTAEMLLRGTPILQLPIFVEQAISGTKTAAMGAGLMVNPRDSSAVATALTTLLDGEQFAAAAGKFANRYAEWDRSEMFQMMMEQIDKLTG